MTSNRTYRRIAATLFNASGRALSAIEQGAGDLARVAAFARGVAEFRVRPDDIFISTYPRSGTTWVQYMLHLLTRQGQEAEFEHLSQVCPWFERSLAVGASRAADFEALPSPRVFKSHLPRGWLPGGARYLYVEREATDVAVSYFHFYRSHLGYAGDMDSFLRRFVRGELQYRAWFDHVAGWRRRADNPSVCLLRYEELLAHPGAALERVAAFLDLPLSRELRAMILERCAFDAMKAQEQRFDFATEFLLQRGTRRGAFLRRGEAGQGGLEISASWQEEFRKREEDAKHHRRPTWRLADFLR